MFGRVIAADLKYRQGGSSGEDTRIQETSYFTGVGHAQRLKESMVKVGFNEKLPVYAWMTAPCLREFATQEPADLKLPPTEAHSRSSQYSPTVVKRFRILQTLKSDVLGPAYFSDGGKGLRIATWGKHFQMHVMFNDIHVNIFVLMYLFVLSQGRSVTKCISRCIIKCAQRWG